MRTNSNTKWLIKMGFAFTAISLGFYYLFYILFHDSQFIYHHFIIDLAFLPIEVFLVATIFENLMERTEKESQLERMHMIIGSFFYEAGKDLIKSFVTYDYSIQNPGQDLMLLESWSKADFVRVKSNLRKIASEIRIDPVHFVELRDLLYCKREYLLHLMENDNLMESEHFSQLLLAIFHLYEELQLRPNLSELQHNDFAHLSDDVRRVFLLLTEQWLDYLYHIKETTPYLFSLAVRTNPFNPEASIEVK